ncbi:RluA family pseudouridine synthase [Patescibacteria group bacterium]|nr:RluA family pseudouridine synthase [Patescibacteria group bacterium]
MNIKIIYEDENLVAINKPTGLVVHSDGKTDEPNVADWVLKNYPETEDVGEPLVLSDERIIKRPGIVHRLDRDTSGILVIAKNQESFLNLKEQFQNRTTQKTYQAFVYGRVKNDEGVIDRPIGRSKNDFRRWTAQRDIRGREREALTEYKVLERGNEYSLVEIYPKTGRTHQIRVHFKAINYPIVCDKLYAPKRECALGFERLALHAYSLEFNLMEGKRIKLEAALPEDFKVALKNLGDN